jgi:hypothetical protein
MNIWKDTIRIISSSWLVHSLKLVNKYEYQYLEDILERDDDEELLPYLSRNLKELNT